MGPRVDVCTWVGGGEARLGRRDSSMAVGGGSEGYTSKKNSGNPHAFQCHRIASACRTLHSHRISLQPVSGNRVGWVSWGEVRLGVAFGMWGLRAGWGQGGRSCNNIVCVCARVCASACLHAWGWGEGLGQGDGCGVGVGVGVRMGVGVGVCGRGCGARAWVREGACVLGFVFVCVSGKSRA
jgi:hypothetical protein